MSDGLRAAILIREMEPDERPRERLFQRGSASLSTTELLAILLNAGIRGEPATAMAQRLMKQFEGLAGLARADPTELAKTFGVGESRAARVKAALELGNRLALAQGDVRPQISTPEDVVSLLGMEMSILDQEQLRVILLDTKHRVLGVRMIYQGSANQAPVRIGEIFRDAVRVNAVAIVVVHNHPSGDPTPSAPDVSMTAEVVKAGEMLDIAVIDHVILGRGRHVSLRRLGLGFPASTT